MNKFTTWYVTHQDAITWFLIGWLASHGLNELAHGNYIQSAVLLGLAGLNYMFRNARVK